MGHAHGHHGGGVSQKLIIAMTATTLFVAVELGVGIVANSLALLGDALHNLTDALALGIALAAVRIERRPPTVAKSYGYQRAGVVAAFINASTLVAFTAFILYEAVSRFRKPEGVDSGLMIATAIAAFILNIAITLSLRKEGEHDVNVRAAEVHMLGDALSSIGIVVAAYLISATGNPIFDPAVSLLIALMILWSSWGILREAVNLLLEGTPTGIDPEAVGQALSAEAGVFGVHHLHIWALGPSRPALSCHVMLGDVPLRNTSDILHRVTLMLEHDYGIVHTTIQFEYANCSEDDPFCIPFTAEADLQRTHVSGQQRADSQRGAPS
jgi:cobalt-zinc-cadmium efflux system protein